MFEQTVFDLSKGESYSFNLKASRENLLHRTIDEATREKSDWCLFYLNFFSAPLDFVSKQWTNMKTIPRNWMNFFISDDVDISTLPLLHENFHFDAKNVNRIKTATMTNDNVFSSYPYRGFMISLSFPLSNDIFNLIIYQLRVSFLRNF